MGMYQRTLTFVGLPEPIVTAFIFGSIIAQAAASRSDDDEFDDMVQVLAAFASLTIRTTVCPCRRLANALAGYISNGGHSVMP